MVLLRLEEEVDDWCRATGEPHDEIVPLAWVWELSRAWFGDRIKPEYRVRTSENAHAIFRDCGLVSDFWLGQSALSQFDQRWSEARVILSGALILIHKVTGQRRSEP